MRHGNEILRRTIERQASEHVQRAAVLLDRIDHSERDDNLHNISLVRVLSAMAVHWKTVSDDFGRERETLQEFARRAGEPYDQQRIVLPFEVFKRDLSKAAASGGGYLVATGATQAVDILRPWSVTARAGVLVETGFTGDSVIPKTTAKGTPYWLTNETAQTTPSQPTIGQAALTPKTAGALTSFSRQLAKQTNAEDYVRRELLKTTGTALDQAVLAGTGASGQPLGIINMSGINTQSGTSLGHAGVAAMKRKVSEANAADEEISFIAAPAVREMLETRERATGSGFIWDDDRVASRPAFVSTDVPASTLLCAAWSSVYVPIWGPGITIELNPYDPTGFKTGTIQARVLLSCDVALLHLLALCKAETIT